MKLIQLTDTVYWWSMNMYKFSIDPSKDGEYDTIILDEV